MVRPGGTGNQRAVRNEQIQGLLDLAEQLHGILVPVEPEGNFRRRLHGELVLEAQRWQAGEEPTMFQQHRKGILIGAAAIGIGSAASVAGVIIAYVVRHRDSGAAHIATG
jgi:hypothetical protein